MRIGQQCAMFAAAVLMVGAAACADRGDMSSESRGDQPAATPGGAGYDTGSTANENRKALTVTGCFQDMSGPNNFVLSNVGDAPGVAPSDTRAYRIEQAGDFEQYVGKKVSITGWVDAADAGTRGTAMTGMPGDATQGTSGAAQGTPSGRATSGDVDFNDLPELHIDTISAQGEACGAAR